VSACEDLGQFCGKPGTSNPRDRANLAPGPASTTAETYIAPPAYVISIDIMHDVR
jgi:hypothetical protein